MDTMSHTSSSYPQHILALDIGGTKIASALVSYSSQDTLPQLSFRTSTPTRAQEGGQAVLSRMLELIKSQLAAIEAQDICVSGIGIDSAGVVDEETGSILYASETIPGYTGCKLQEETIKRFGLPCAVIGDVQAHCLGEARFGAGKGYPHVLMVAAGTGLGGAFSYYGRVMRGAHGAAGHLGHTLHPAAKEYLCSCGAFGHIENLASGIGIGGIYQETSPFSDNYKPDQDGAWVSARAQEGELKAQEALRFSGFCLGEALGSWANLLDPHIIILSGSVLRAGHLWFDAIHEGFKSQALELLRQTPLVAGSLEDAAALIGAAENLRDTL